MTSRVIETVPAQIVDEDHVRIGGSEFARVYECRNISNDDKLFKCGECGAEMDDDAASVRCLTVDVSFCQNCGARVMGL